MLTATKIKTDAGYRIELKGAFEEQVNLPQLIGEVSGTLEINCRGITRINSVGVREWIRYFQNIQGQAVQLEFSECSQPIVDQLNMISNFAAGGKVVSILLPFSCSKCAVEFNATCKVSDLKASGLQVPTVKCDKQECAAVFDHDPDEFFSFMKF